MTEDMLDEGTWDLGEVLAERAQPTETVTVYLNEVASYTKSQLMKSKPKGDEANEAWDKALEEVEEILGESEYVIHLTAVPSRMREDIASKAMSQIPIKPNLLGSDDPNNAIQRQKLENDMTWHAQITDVVNPKGLHKREWTFEEMQKFSESMPTNVQKTVDDAIRDLTKAAEAFTVASKNADF